MPLLETLLNISVKFIDISHPVIAVICGFVEFFEFDLAFSHLPNNVTKIISFGESGKIINKICKKYNILCYRVKWLHNVKNILHNVINFGDNVLLSPACASFDEFDGFDKRGDFFKKIVKEMTCDEQK